MGANGLVVGDRLPSHSDDYTTTPHRTCVSVTRDTSPTSRGPARRGHAIPFFFPTTVSCLSDRLIYPSVRPSFSAPSSGVLISLIITCTARKTMTLVDYYTHDRGGPLIRREVYAARHDAERVHYYLLRDFGVCNVCARIHNNNNNIIIYHYVR